jgi:formylglycine-generating enzyme required for sulfatase activity
MAVDLNARYQTVADLQKDVGNVLERIEREKELMARAQGEMKNLAEIRGRIKTLEETLPFIWSKFSLGAQINEAQWNQMHDPINDLIQMKGAWHRKVEDIITPLLIGNSKYGRLPRAQELIADLSLLRLMHEGDRIADADRQFLIRRIRENDPSGKFSAVLDRAMHVGLSLVDFYSREAIPEDVHLKVIPYVREEKRNNYREGSAVVTGLLSEIRSQLNLPAGYYAFEFSHPDYAPMRVPVHIKLKNVRSSVIDNHPFNLEFEFVPQERVPEGMVVIHQGVATLGHDFYLDGSPTTNNSPPMRKIPFDTFAASRTPVTVGEYKIFVESLLEELNNLIEEGRNQEAIPLIEKIREILPQAHSDLKTRISLNHENLTNAFEVGNFYWNISAERQGEHLQFRLIDPTSHRDPHGDPILLNQPMTVLNFASGEAYAAWRSWKDGVSYKVISAREKEIISRNSFSWTYPWGYEFNPSFLASRLSFIDIKKDSYVQPVGTHALGPEFYRDKSLYGNVDLLGNAREFASPESEATEPDMVYLSGGSVRAAFGVLFLPSARGYVNKREWTEQCGGAFRLSLETSRNKP